MSELRSPEDWRDEHTTRIRTLPDDAVSADEFVLEADIIRDIQRNALEAAVTFVRHALGRQCHCPTGATQHFTDCAFGICQEMADELETLIPKDPAPEVKP